MITQAKRDELLANVRAFIASGPIDQTDVQQAYDLLYPDQIDFGTFVHVWIHCLRGDQDEAEHAATLAAAGGIRIIEIEQPAAEVKPDVTQNDSPSPPAHLSEANEESSAK